MGLLSTLRQRARHLKSETLALWLAARDPRTPWYAKALVFIVVAYALSPIDLIPDFIPVLGYLDDLVLVPLGIALALRWVPPEVMAQCRARARHTVRVGARLGWLAAGVVLLLWAGALGLAGGWAWRWWQASP